MSITTLRPVNQRWYSAYRKILFGINQPFYPQGYISVADDGNGNAVFTRANFLLYPYYDKSFTFYVESGIYAGFHNIKSYDSTTEEIFTDTPFIGNDPTPPFVITNFYQVVPFGYKVYYGYPTQTQSVTLKAFHKQDGTAYIDVSSVLQNQFQIQPPALGYDDSMYTYFKIDYVPLGDFATFLSSLSLTIDTFTGWNYALETYYCINGTLPHSILQTKVTNDEWLNDTEPIFAQDCCNVMSKIINNRVYNFRVCPDGTIGIGYMEIENTFIID